LTDIIEARVVERKHPLAHCEDCPLYTVGAYVPSKFPQGGRAKFVAVGEAPGYSEAVNGEPFVGPSGKLLKRVLEHHGIGLESVVLTNATSCRPPDNATPPKAAVLACRPRLLAEIEASGAEQVLALGATAAQALLGTTQGILELRKSGAVESPLLGGLPVVPTVHPAFCLRNGDNFPHLVRDVERLVRVTPPWSPPKYIVAEAEPIDDPSLVLEEGMGLLPAKVDPGADLATLKPTWDITYPVAVLTELHGYLMNKAERTRTRPKLVIDIECGIEKDKSFDHPNEYQMLCVGLGFEKGRIVVVGEQALRAPRIREMLKILFGLCDLEAWNGKFDLAGLYPLLGKFPLRGDGMLRHYILDERPGNHGLKARANEDLGAPQYDRELDKYITKRSDNYSVIPRPILYKYNAYDIACTWDLMERYEADLVEMHQRFDYDAFEAVWGYRPWTPMQLHDHMCEAASQLIFLELNGIKVDKEYSRELENEYLEEIARIEEQMDDILNETTGKSLDLRDPELAEAEPNRQTINPRSPKQLKEFFHSQGLRVASTNVDTLEALQKRVRDDSKVGRFIVLLLQHRRKAKLHGTYIKGIRARTYRGRVYTTYLLHGTTSGRLASRNPNLQNVVRDKSIRRQFVPGKEGNILVQADYSQAEGRVICWLAKDEYLRSIFMDPSRKLFNELSDQLYGVGNWDKERYVLTKTYFYGLAYGRDAYSISMAFGMSLRDAELGLSTFMSLIPAVSRWQKKVRDTVLSGTDLVTPFGRRRRFWLITKENRKDVLNEALSFLPQSTASDVCLRAFIRLRPMLAGKAFIRLTIHDALVAECAPEDLEFVGATMQRVMREEGEKLTTYVPWMTDLSSGVSWGDI
jgi:uracil-DNA glycosylase family 4